MTTVNFKRLINKTIFIEFKVYNCFKHRIVTALWGSATQTPTSFLILLASTRGE